MGLMPRAQNGPSGSPRGRGAKAAGTPPGEAAGSWLSDIRSACEDHSRPCSVFLARRGDRLSPQRCQRLLPRDRDSARVAACMCVPVGSWASQRTPGYFPAPCLGVGLRRSPRSSSDAGSLAVRHGKIKVKIWLLTVWWRADGGPPGVPLEKAPLRHRAACWRRRTQVWRGLEA